MRSIPAPATIISVVALFVATAGGGYAAGQAFAPEQQVMKLQRQVTALELRANADEAIAQALQVHAGGETATQVSPAKRHRKPKYPIA